MISLRHECILCTEEHPLQVIETIPFPIYDCTPEDVSNGVWDLTYGYCSHCFSIQSMTLLDPNILYDKHYFQPLHESYWWVRHNITLVKFIIDCIEIHRPLIEIGSSSFCIGKHLLHYYPDFTVFDYCLDQATRMEGVHYIEGNCENYSFPRSSTIIMSHVFEHLYEPRFFIQNCSKNQVENIIIAVPDMSNPNEIHCSNLHTFTYSENDLEYIFSKGGYYSKHKAKVNTGFPVLFYHFQKSDDIVHVNREIDTERHTPMISFLTSSISVPEKTFIATAAMLSNIIYSKITNKENIIGIIDMSKQRQNKKHICNHFVQPYEYLVGYGSDTNILVFGPHKESIKKNIRKVNTEINIIEI